MVKRATKKKKPSAGTKGGSKRRERRFSTSAAFMPLWVAWIGIGACLALGAGVFGLWIADPAVSWANYLVAAGGVGLGISLWFGQPDETAVAVGDSGVAVETGRQTLRVPWFEMRSVRVTGGTMLIEGRQQTLKFLIGANRNATARLLKEAALRVPNVLDVAQSIAETLPDPDKVRGFLQEVEDDQITGIRCAFSEKLINLEEDARLCPKCGQIFHKDSVPDTCPDCEAELKGHVLLA